MDTLHIPGGGDYEFTECLLVNETAGRYALCIAGAGQTHTVDLTGSTLTVNAADAGVRVQAGTYGGTIVTAGVSVAGATTEDIVKNLASPIEPE
jgi:hypothetical protein